MKNAIKGALTAAVAGVIFAVGLVPSASASDNTPSPIPAPSSTSSPQFFKGPGPGKCRSSIPLKIHLPISGMRLSLSAATERILILTPLGRTGGLQEITFSHIMMHLTVVPMDSSSVPIRFFHLIILLHQQMQH